MKTEYKKPCIKCGKKKELKYFPKHPETRDGHANRCKDCVHKYNKDRYTDNWLKIVIG